MSFSVSMGSFPKAACNSIALYEYNMFIEFMNAFTGSAESSRSDNCFIVCDSSVPLGVTFTDIPVRGVIGHRVVRGCQIRKPNCLTGLTLLYISTTVMCWNRTMLVWTLNTGSRPSGHPFTSKHDACFLRETGSFNVIWLVSRHFQEINTIDLQFGIHQGVNERDCSGASLCNEFGINGTREIEDVSDPEQQKEDGSYRSVSDFLGVF